MSVLINNAGLGGGGPFNLSSDEDTGNLVSVNILHPTYLTKVYLNHCLNRNQKSCIINVGSLMELHPFPGYCMYSSSKAFINNFSRAIWAEVNFDPTLNKKVDVFLWSPSFISTKINGMNVVWGLIPDPLSACETAMHDVGRFSSTHGRWFDAVQASFILFLGKYWPSVLESRMYKRAMRKHLKK